MQNNRDDATRIDTSQSPTISLQATKHSIGGVFDLNVINHKFEPRFGQNEDIKFVFAA